MINKKPIGVFDSGVGGLTSLEYLINLFPNEDFIYIGDTKNCPYGIKTKCELELIVKNMIHHFEKKDVKMIVIACNTATSNSYDIKSAIPIVRIIEPTARVANEVGKNIGVLATNYTISSKAYDMFLTKTPVSIPASVLVNIVEEGKQNTKESFTVVNNLLNPYKDKIDTLILGCTHFGLLENDITKVLNKVKIVSSSACLAEEVKKVITLNHLENDKSHKGVVKISVTSNPLDIKMDWFKYPYSGVFLETIETENKKND